MTAKRMSPYSNGLAIKRSSQGWFGYVNKNDIWIIMPKYLRSKPFVNGEAIVITKVNRTIKIDTKGKKL